MLENTPNKILLGKIISAHGIKGEVKIKSFSSPPSSICSYKMFETINGVVSEIKFRDNCDADTLIAKIIGVNDRNGAEALKGTELFVDEKYLLEAADDEFYYKDLIGLKAVHHLNDESLGEVLGVYNFGAGDIVEIGIDSKDSIFYSFNNEICVAIDLDNKIIRILPPEFV